MELPELLINPDCSGWFEDLKYNLGQRWSHDGRGDVGTGAGKELISQIGEGWRERGRGGQRGDNCESELQFLYWPSV